MHNKCYVTSSSFLLGVRSTICRHQPPQRTVLGQVGCFIQCEVVGSQISLDSVGPHDTRTPWWSLPVVWWGAGSIILASASSSIRAICPNMERCHDWIIAVSLGYLAILDITCSKRTVRRNKKQWNERFSCHRGTAQQWKQCKGSILPQYLKDHSGRCWSRQTLEIFLWNTYPWPVPVWWTEALA